MFQIKHFPYWKKQQLDHLLFGWAWTARKYWLLRWDYSYIPLAQTRCKFHLKVVPTSSPGFSPSRPREKGREGKQDFFLGKHHTAHWFYIFLGVQPLLIFYISTHRGNKFFWEVLKKGTIIFFIKLCLVSWRMTQLRFTTLPGGHAEICL